MNAPELINIATSAYAFAGEVGLSYAFGCTQLLPLGAQSHVPQPGVTTSSGKYKVCIKSSVAPGSNS